LAQFVPSAADAVGGHWRRGDCLSLIGRRCRPSAR
jgi:hypothetical protein